MSNTITPFIIIRHKNTYVKVFYAAILYLKADGNQTIFHVVDPSNPKGVSKYYTGYHLGYYIKSLGALLFRTHKSYLIKLDRLKIVNVNRTVELDDPNVGPLPVGRKFYSELLRLFKDQGLG